MLNNPKEIIEGNPGEDVADNSTALSIDKASPPTFSLCIKSNVINSVISFSILLILFYQLILNFFSIIQERIEVTITKTCMDVIRTLSQSFNNAVYLKSSNLAALNEAGFSSYKFINDFGTEIEVSLKAAKPVIHNTKW